MLNKAGAMVVGGSEACGPNAVSAFCLEHDKERTPPACHFGSRFQNESINQGN
jgi:hypothetical protein